MIAVFRHKWVRILCWVVLAVLVLWGLSWAIVPPVLKSQVQRIAGEKLGRAVTIGAVEFKPWSLELTVHDFEVAGAPGAKAPLLHADTLYANAELQSVVRLAPVIDALTVQGLRVAAAYLGEGRYDFDDVLHKLEETPPDAKPSSEPARFALYNVQLLDGAADFDDRTRQQHHELRDLTLAIPFISSFDSKRDVTVEPRLAFTLNGSHFDSAASSLPFAQTRKTDATLAISKLDLQPYLEYIPSSVPVKVQGAVLDAELKVGFEQTPETSVVVSGNVGASALKVADAGGAPLFSLDQLKVPITELRVLRKSVHLGAITLDGPHLAVRRDAQGRINLAMAGAPEAAAPVHASASAAGARAAAPVSSPASAAGPGASASASAASASSVTTPSTSASAVAASASAGSRTAGDPNAPYGGWHVVLDSVALKGGAVEWNDAAAGAKPAQIALSELDIDAQGIALPFEKPLSFKLSGSLGGDARLSAQGTATDKAADVKIDAERLPLALAAPYVEAFLAPSMSGRLGAAAQVHWAAPSTVKVDAGQMALDDFALASSDPQDRRGIPTASASASPSRKGASSRTPSGKAAAQTPTPQRGQDGQGAGGAVTVAGVKQIEVSGVNLDLAARRATVGQLKIVEPNARVSRAADGQWMYQRWLKTPAASAPEAGRGTTAKAAAQGSSPWSVSLGEVSVSKGSVIFNDQAIKPAVAVSLTQFDASASKLSLDSRQPSPVQVSARVGAGRTEFGSLKFRGQVGLDPVSAQGDVDASRLPVHAFAPYLGDLLNVKLVRADTSFKGKVRYAAGAHGPTAKVTGDAQVDKLLVLTYPVPVETAAAGSAGAASTLGAARPASAAAALAAEAGEREGEAARRPGSIASILRQSQQLQGDELLSWESLAVHGADVELAPGKPLSVAVGQTTATDLFARLVLREDARLNLQDIFKTAANQAPEAAQGAGREVHRTERPGHATAEVQLPARPAPAASIPAPVLRFGPTKLVNAKVLFTDHFVRPNYSASLTELSGQLGPFSSQDTAPADLALAGRAEGTASLEITGKLNPLAKPLALDIAGKVRDLELPPLTPYSVKYSGYGIERGKMSVDVHYRVEPSGQLTADNKVVLNQLTFGEKVPGATASLPVKLAVALLADRNGVIDVDLPVSGSLNDPQFSIGGIIGRAILNLVVKAITAPFSLLANMFGGGGGGVDQGGSIQFHPGTITLDASARAKLDKVAQALADRPALKVTVVGTSSVDLERDAYRHAQLDELLRAEKRRRTAGSATPAASAASGAGVPAPLEITAAERPELIRAVYRNADIPKPRNAFGFARDIEPAQMESILLANIKVNDESIRELAVGRGVAVRDYLAGHHLSPDRIFLGAPKATQGPPPATPDARPAQGAAVDISSVGVAASAAGALAQSAAASAPSSKAWVPSAELTLSPS